MTCDPNVIAAILRKDFYTFVQAAFPVVSPGTPFLPNWHIEAMTSVLTDVLDGHINRLIITVPPRHLKSMCASIAFPAFALGRDPTRQIVCVSYSDSLARNLANSCRTLMRSELYQRVFPNTRIGKDTELEITTTARGSRFATSVGGTLTGRGGNFIIIDDPMKPQDAYWESARANVREWYSNTLMSQLNNKSTDAIVVVMQRLHVDDLVGHLLEQDGWYHLSLPAIVDTDQVEYLKSAFGKWRPYHRKAGEALHPTREPPPVLKEIEREMGSRDFAAQYLQQPMMPEGNLVKWKWFRTHDDPPAYKPGDRIIVSWDTALSAKDLASARIEMGSVSLPRQAHWLDEFRKEISAFPSGRHNDQVDAFSQGLNEAFNPHRRGESGQGFAMGLFH